MTKQDMKINLLRQGHASLSVNYGAEGKVTLGISNGCTEKARYYIHLTPRNVKRLRRLLDA